MPDIAKMRELIHPQAIVAVHPDQYGKNEVELFEPQEPDSQIRIAGIPDNCIIYNLDDFFPPPNRIFAGERSESCRADYVLIATTEKDRQIVFIELKKDDDDNAHIKNQLLGAECFSNYCASILNVFWHYKFPLDKYQKHYVCCKYTSSARRSTKYDANAPANTTINSMLTLVGNHTFQYNQLIAKKPK